MTKGVRQLAWGFSLSIIMLSMSLVYWQVVSTETLLDNPANRRLILLEQRVTRGGIFDRNGEILAQTKMVEGKKSRIYPKGETTEPLLGYATLQHGSAGLEAYLGEWLLGVKDATAAQELEQAFALPRQGNDVVLTLDSRLQRIAYEGLKGKVGSAVAIDPRNGEVLALVSQPSFDPNDLDKNWTEITKKSGSPLLNHAFALFTPGSAMKVITSAALLRSGIDTGDLYHCTGSVTINGQTIREQNEKVHGWVNYNMALAESCNTYFAALGVQGGEEQFVQVAQAFGFGSEIPFELPIKKSSLTNAQALPSRLDTNLLAASTFGQGEVMVSPFHMALITAGIANRGVIMTPHIVSQVMDPNQKAVYKSRSQPWLTPLSSEEAAKIKSAMVSAVNEGTAASGALWGHQVAGKTGSAETGGEKRSHAWYIAFAPAESPRIAVAVLVEHGGTGSAAAAPVAKDMMQAALNLKVGEQK